MNEVVFDVYKCYLGKHLLYRTAAIYDFVLENGVSFFYSYSTSSDTILVFLKKCIDLGLIKTNE